MPTPRRPARRSNSSHLLEAIQHLQEAETVLGRIADRELSASARTAVAAMRRCLDEAKRHAADAVESLSGGALERRESSAAVPLFMDGRADG